jgi:hypothetical protein
LIFSGTSAIAEHAAMKAMARVREAMKQRVLLLGILLPPRCFPTFMGMPCQDQQRVNRVHILMLPLRVDTAYQNILSARGRKFKVNRCPPTDIQMKVIAFTTNYPVIDKIIHHLGVTLTCQRPPPPSW